MQIRKLTIKRFRGFESLEWLPDRGVNCLVGPADSGKSTVLSAIALLLSPTPSPVVSEFDYHKREIENGFQVEAVLAGVDPEILGRIPMVRGWRDGELVSLPDEDGAEAVIVVRVTGSPDLEVSHQIVPESSEPVSFSGATRQSLPFAQVNIAEYFLREFRLGRGSLLDKTIKGSGLRGLVPGLIGKAEVNLPEDVSGRLEKLKVDFKKAGLPGDLSLGIISPYGYSLTGMIGLLCGPDRAKAIPLALAGSGTQQRALFELATALVEAGPLLVLDEPESGLEPYRQRALVRRVRSLIGDRGQAFVTTHSPTVVSGMQQSELYRLPGPQAKPIHLDSPQLAPLFKSVADMFLARLPVLCEGITEVGLFDILLDSLADAEIGSDLDSLGIRLLSGAGQPTIFDQAKALWDAGMVFGLFVDAEDAHKGRRDKFRAEPKCAFGSWEESGARNIEEAVSRFCSREQIEVLITRAAATLDRSPDDLLRQVNENLKTPGTRPLSEAWRTGSEEDVRRALAQAMNKGNWFKSRPHGQELGRFLKESGIPVEVEKVVAALWKRLLDLLG